jgi:hypothetical protein
MTTQKKDSKGEKKSRIKIDKLTNSNEAVKDLTDKEAEQIKGGFSTFEHATTEAIKAIGNASAESARKA